RRPSTRARARRGTRWWRDSEAGADRPSSLLSSTSLLNGVRVVGRERALYRTKVRSSGVRSGTPTARDGTRWPQPRPSSRLVTRLSRCARRGRGLLPVGGGIPSNLRGLELRFLGQLHVDARVGQGEAQPLIRAGPHHADVVLVVHGSGTRAAAERAARDGGHEQPGELLHSFQIEYHPLGDDLRDADVSDAEPR